MGSLYITYTIITIAAISNFSYLVKISLFISRPGEPPLSDFRNNTDKLYLSVYYSLGGRERDLNPRTDCSSYTRSRRASSTFT